MPILSTDPNNKRNFGLYDSNIFLWMRSWKDPYMFTNQNFFECKAGMTVPVVTHLRYVCVHFKRLSVAELSENY